MQVGHVHWVSQLLLYLVHLYIPLFWRFRHTRGTNCLVLVVLQDAYLGATKSSDQGFNYMYFIIYFCDMLWFQEVFQWQLTRFLMAMPHCLNANEKRMRVFILSPSFLTSSGHVIYCHHLVIQLNSIVMWPNNSGFAETWIKICPETTEPFEPKLCGNEL